MNASRRHFLRSAACLSTSAPWLSAAPSSLALSLAGMGALAAETARAASVSDYRALVCLFMAGGNDSHNWIVPVDPSGYAEYVAARRELALPAARIQAITASRQDSGRSFGMPVELSPLRQWYDAGKLAVLANVGPLVQPLTKAQYLANGLGIPPKLYSHNDQQSTWQSLLPEGAAAGWGGRIGDALMSANTRPVFTSVSATGNVVFLSGRNVSQYQVGMNGPLGVDALSQTWVMGSSTAAPVVRRVLTMSGNNAFHTEYVRVMQRSLDTTGLLTTALAGTRIAALPTSVTLASGSALNLSQDPLARQLRMVAQMIAAGPDLGMRRQIFMVQMGGFDTHTHQMRDEPLLMGKVAHAMNWFLSTMQAAGLLDRTTLFTASEFGRTLSTNGQGSDHGWGGHHFIAGGAVKGGDIYGDFPVTALGTATDVGRGRLLPTTSVAEYAATLGRWMGLNTGELVDVLPTLGNFSNQDLGFLT